jgi:hypothetical protein
VQRLAGCTIGTNVEQHDGERAGNCSFGFQQKCNHVVALSSVTMATLIPNVPATLSSRHGA